MPGTVYALLGPTASGKSTLALEAAGKLPLEIVSMDSALVYRGMDIGTAKPSAAQRARVPHHLVDLIDPDQAYSAGRWRQAAIAKVKEVMARDDMQAIRRTVEELQQASQAMAQHMQGRETAAAGAKTSGNGQNGRRGQGKDDVIDAEYEVKT